MGWTIFLKKNNLLTASFLTMHNHCRQVCFIRHFKITTTAVVVPQLAERSLPTPDDPGSN